jgi:hypothetical protein
MISRSKIVLNHHFYDCQIFEIVRIFYLLTNSVAVVGEVNDATNIQQIYKNAIYHAPYDGLVDACVKLISDLRLREELGRAGLSAIKKIPQAFFTKEILLE